MLFKNQIVYYTRILPNLGIYDVIELKIRTVEEDWFCGTDKMSKQAFIFNNSDLEHRVFIDRNIALQVVKEAEKSRTNFNTETYYEEY